MQGQAEEQSDIIEWVDPNDPKCPLMANKFSLQVYGEDSCEDLVESIRELGVLQPLYATPKWVIISGHRRWKAARIAGRRVPVIRKGYPTTLDEHRAIIEHNRQRIKTGLQLYNEGKALEEIEREKARQRQVQGGKQKVLQNFAEAPDERLARTQIARAIGLGSGEQWRKLEYVGERAPQLLPEISPGGMTIYAAYKQVKQEERKQLRSEPIVPQGKFQVIVVDPPWPYQSRAEDITHRARSPYPSMSLEEIKALHIPAADDCILWLWTTNAFVHDAFHVLEAWEFEPKTILTWAKDRIGLGDWLRGQTEHCILAIRGNPTVRLTNQSTLIQGPLREHSRKPDEFYALVESLCPGTKLEMFARTERQGWAYHGNERKIF